MPQVLSSAAKSHPARLPAEPANGAALSAHSAWKRGLALRKSGQLKAACDCFAQATRLAPQDGLYWLNLARCEQQLGRGDQAIASAQRAFALDRGSLVACTLLAEMKRDAHRTGEMLAVLDQLDPVVERDAQWHLLCGVAQLAERHVDIAAQSFLSVLSLSEGDLAMRRNALVQLGHCFAQLRRHRDAGQCYRMVLDMDPLALGNAIYAVHYSAWACDWATLEEDIARLDRCLSATRDRPDGAATEQVSPFCLLGLSDDPHLMKWLAEQACAHRNTRPSEQMMPRPSSEVLRPGGKLRIGWISSDFHQHATTHLLAEVLEGFNRDRFELVFYSGGPDDRTAVRRRVMGTASQVHEVAQWSDEELADQIRQDQIGVLIDLKGFTLGSRFHVMALRPAPIQIAWLGYPGTSGADFIDYIVGDPVVTPMAAQAYYSECIAQMPHCYQPNDSQRSRPVQMPRNDCGLPDDAFVFASFNQSYKILPPVFEAWCRILAATPRSVLWLLVPEHDIQARLRDAAGGHGITPERLVFAPFANIERHRARLPNADLFLDTFPCGGHTTASDALWAGVPVLTMIGETFASRVAASLVTTVGLPELVCANLDEYVTQAVRLAADTPALVSLRQRLADGSRQSPLFDGRRFARDFEQLLLRMVERQDAGLPPDSMAAIASTNEPWK